MGRLRGVSLFARETSLKTGRIESCFTCEYGDAAVRRCLFKDKDMEIPGLPCGDYSHYAAPLTKEQRKELEEIRWIMFRERGLLE